MATRINSPNPPIYVYDGECVLCSRAVRYTLKYDRKDPPLKYVAIKSAEGRGIAKHNDVNPEEPHTFIYVENGKHYVLSDAVFAIAKHVGGPWRFITVFSILPRPIRDWLYLRIALNRYKLFGKLDSCYLPSSEFKNRFILD